MDRNVRFIVRPLAFRFNILFFWICPKHQNDFRIVGAFHLDRRRRFRMAKVCAYDGRPQVYSLDVGVHPNLFSDVSHPRLKIAQKTKNFVIMAKFLKHSEYLLTNLTKAPFFVIMLLKALWKGEIGMQKTLFRRDQIRKEIEQLEGPVLTFYLNTNPLSEEWKIRLKNGLKRIV